MELDLEIIKEPRGFIRALQFVFSICAFATTTSYSSYFSYKLTCSETEHDDVSQSFSYPFKLDHIEVTQSFCNKTDTIRYFGDFSSDAQFYVATGVLTMLYSMATVAVYVLFSKLYSTNRVLPMVDFLVSLVLGVFWLSGSAAWASSLSSLKYVTNPDNFSNHMALCKLYSCAAEYAGNFAKLNISIIFGFLNFFLWASNLWFLYKETSWFSGISPANGADMPGP